MYVLNLLIRLYIPSFVYVYIYTETIRHHWHVSVNTYIQKQMQTIAERFIST